MPALDAYLEAVAAYRELCIRDGALATAVFNNGLAATKLKARILAFALTDTREDFDIACERITKAYDKMEQDLNFADKLHRVKLDLASGGYPQNTRVEND